MRDSLTVIIVLLIIAILVDGVRRMRLARRDKIRMSPHIYKSGARDDATADSFTSELPNGGARVVGQRNLATKTAKTSKFKKRDSHNPEQASLNLETAVPMLMESVVDDVLMKDATGNNTATTRDEQTDRPYQDNGRIEPTLSIDAPDDADTVTTSYDRADLSTDDDEDENGYHEGDLEDERADDEDADPEEVYLDDESAEDYDAEDYDDDEYYQDDEDDIYDDDEDDAVEEDIHDEYSGRTADTSSASPVTSASNEYAANEPEEVLIINIMASKGEIFRGDALLEVLLECGMRFGDMNIFHRYSDKKGEGALLFSLANMVKPGTFDLDTMDEFETPGVSLFMTLPIKADSMQSFELMVDTARTIADELNGELKDEQRSVMTRQTIDHCRERIRDFERRRLFSRQR
jgi:cell division protein ZipA